MSLRKGFLGLCVFIFCFGTVCAKTVKVDCFKGKSINAVLNAHKNADELTIEIDGICDENVIVQRDNVTLLGINLDGEGEPLDGIRGVSTDEEAPPSFGNVLWIRDVANVRVENLRIFGGARDGIRIRNAYIQIDVINCILEENDRNGLRLLSARVDLDFSTVRGNGRTGVFVRQAAVRLNESTIDEDDEAIRASEGVVSLRDSTVMSGSFIAREKSFIELRDTNQMANPDRNRINDDSQLLARDSSVVGHHSTQNKKSVTP